MIIEYYSVTNLLLMQKGLMDQVDFEMSLEKLEGLRQVGSRQRRVQHVSLVSEDLELDNSKNGGLASGLQKREKQGMLLDI